MKTFLFATMYLYSKLSIPRYLKYLNFYTKLYPTMDITNLILIDDGSNIDLLSELQLPVFKNKTPSWLPPISIFTFSNHEGRRSINNFPGWYRSFLFSIFLAEYYNFDKIIHIESDAYILTEKLCKYLTELTSGWTTMWCPRYGMPETQIQVIYKDQYSKIKKIVFKTNMGPEQYFPFTSINKDFKGDRYGEYTEDLPLNVDFLCQATYALIDEANKRILNIK